MSPMSPETAVSPMAEAPPDRPTIRVEQAARQFLALLLGDRKLDQEEMVIVRDFFEQIATVIQNGGVVGAGAPPVSVGGEKPPMPSPMEMNANTQDMGTVEGAEPEDEGGY